MTFGPPPHPCFLRRPTIRSDEKPVASVRPVQSTPIPMMPRQVSLGIPGSSSGINFPVNYLQKAGVYVQRIITTTGNNNAPSLAGQCSLAHHYTHTSVHLKHITDFPQNCHT